MLFSNVIHVDASARKRTESLYSYIDRSASSEIVDARLRLESWLNNYPQDKKTQLERRFRVKGDDGFYGACFELYLHELLLRLGTLSEVENLARSVNSNIPDFFVTDPDGSTYYLEARVNTGNSEKQRSNDARIQTVLDAIDDVESPDFFINIEKFSPYSKNNINIRTSNIRNGIEKWVRGIDYDALLQQHHDTGTIVPPSRVFTDDQADWSVTVSAWPKSPENRHVGDGAIGVTMGNWTFMNTHETIKTALTKKAKKYGQLLSPFIIAVNVLQTPFEWEIAFEALFGTEAYRIEGEKLTPMRNPDGFFRPGRNNNVSAVLIVDRFFPWNIGKVCLFHNPGASMPYTGKLNTLPRFDKSPTENEFVFFDGTDVKMIF